MIDTDRALDRAHYEQLAQQLGAYIRYDSTSIALGGMGEYADLYTHTLHLVSPDAPGTYWTALHELGHIATTTYREALLTEGNDQLKVELEVRAWDWAFAHARRPIDDTGRSSVAWSLVSYFATRGVPRDDERVARLIDAVGTDPDWTLDPVFPPAVIPHAWAEWQTVLNAYGRGRIPADVLAA